MPERPESEPVAVSLSLGAGTRASTDPTKDDELRRGAIHTEISRPLAGALVALFLLVIYAVPLSQAVLEKKRGEPPFVLELFKHRPTGESLHQFESDLEKNSDPKAFVQPQVQAWLTRLGRVGNKKAVVGLDGFLYYVPGVQYVSGPGFLDPRQIELRERAARDANETLSADPLRAIVAFDRALAERGIELILFPVPDKAMLEPSHLTRRGDPGARRAVAQNPDFTRFAAELATHGVALFDATPPALEPTAPRRYLIQDTHWTPRFMQEVAENLARFIEARAHLPRLEHPPVLTRVAQPVERLGDIADMLKLPEDQTLFAPERVSVNTVKTADGNDWESDPTADVLLLGDSFTNVFTLDYMGWGSAAGLAPQLAYVLGRNLDVIAQNDSGAFATRQALALALAQDPERLAGKRAVVWEFAMRELAVGDWKPIEWPRPSRAVQR